MDNKEILLKTLQNENELIGQNYDKLQEKFNELNNKYLEEKEINKKIILERENLQKKLDSIIYSRSYKLVQKIKKVFRR